MKELIVHADAGSRYIARRAEEERNVDRLDAESILRHLVKSYDSARDQNGDSSWTVETTWLRGALDMARQFVADRDQMARLRQMQEREASNQEGEGK